MLHNFIPAVRQSSQKVEGKANSSNKILVAKTVENKVKLTIERTHEKSPIHKEIEENGEINMVGGLHAHTSLKITLV